MRATLFLAAGLLTAVSACSRPASDAAPEATDAPSTNPDLALTAPTGETPVASAMEMHREQPPSDPRPDVPTAEPETVEQRRAEPLGVAAHDDHGVATEPVELAATHVHPKAADPADAVSAPAPGGGKPDIGMTEGRGPVPDRGWGGIGGVMDDPNPLPGVTGRGGAVIIRGGAGGVDDDCAIHRPRGNAGVGAGTLVNDRDPRRGTLINERAPRTPGGGAFPRGGGMLRGGIR